MPNLTPALTDVEMVRLYVERIAGSGYGDSVFAGRIHPTLYLTKDTTPGMIEAAAPFVSAAKYYPHGGTTNSGSRLATPHDLKPGVLSAMEDLGMVLCLHAEVTEDVQPDPLLRERDFIPHLGWLVRSYPNLKMVVEHVSDRFMLKAVLDIADTVAASITAHHPFVTYWEAQHDPHCMCMPIAKTPSDRSFLAGIILEAHEYSNIFFGSDSAPHTLADKLKGKFGVWSSPVAIPVLWEHFDLHGDEDKWEAFVAFMCTNGADFYGIGPSLEQRPTMTLRREAWHVPERWPIGDLRHISLDDPERVLIPWRAGEVLPWRVEGMEWFGYAVDD